MHRQVFVYCALRVLKISLIPDGSLYVLSVGRQVFGLVNPDIRIIENRIIEVLLYVIYLTNLVNIIFFNIFKIYLTKFNCCCLFMKSSKSNRLHKISHRHSD